MKETDMVARGKHWINSSEKIDFGADNIAKGKTIHPRGMEMRYLTAYVRSFARKKWKKITGEFLLSFAGVTGRDSPPP